MQILLLTLLTAYVAATLFRALKEAGDDWPPLTEIHASGELPVIRSVVPADWYVPLSEPIVPEPLIAHLVTPVTQSRF